MSEYLRCDTCSYEVWWPAVQLMHDGMTCISAGECDGNMLRVIRTEAAGPGPKTLKQLVDADGSDAKTDKGFHGYLPIYERLFSPLRDSPLPVLEIGVGNGGSLRVWRDYFPNAEVHGIDIHPVPDLGPRITTWRGDIMGSVRDAVLSVVTTFGIVIDDGGHHGDQQETAFRTFWPKVAPGGYYIIEDLHCAYRADFTPSAMPFLKDMADAVNGHGEPSDIESIQFYPKLFIAKKRDPIYMVVDLFDSDPEGKARTVRHMMPMEGR